MYRVEWKEEALESLSKIGDWVKEEKIKNRVERELEKNPYKGGLLKGDLKNRQSLHLFRQQIPSCLWSPPSKTFSYCGRSRLKRRFLQKTISET